mgnify:CR=1 FL=1
MGLGGVAIAVLPYVIHPKTAVLGRAGGGTHGSRGRAPAPRLDQREERRNER